MPTIFVKDLIEKIKDYPNAAVQVCLDNPKGDEDNREDIVDISIEPNEDKGFEDCGVIWLKINGENFGI